MHYVFSRNPSWCMGHPGTDLGIKKGSKGAGGSWDLDK